MSENVKNSMTVLGRGLVAAVVLTGVLALTPGWSSAKQKIPTVTGGAAPQSTVASVVDGAHLVTEHWSWNVPQSKVLVLPAVEGPSGSPYVAGAAMKKGISQALMTVHVVKGSGWKQFQRPSVVAAKKGSKWVVMRGWPKGTVLTNSVWPPPYKSSRLTLSVTFTSNPQDAARMAPAHCRPVSLLFPWGRRPKACS